MKIKVSNKSSGLILEDGKEIHFWLPKMDKSDSPPPNSAWFVLCLVQLLGKYDQRLNDLIDEKRDEMIKETTKLTLVKGGGRNDRQKHQCSSNRSTKVSQKDSRVQRGLRTHAS